MPVAELIGDRIVVATEYRDKERIREVPGTRWDTKAQTWWCALSWAACVQLRAVFGTDLKIGVALNEWAKQEMAGRIRPCLDLRIAEDAPELAERFPLLRPFQRAGVKFMATAKAALNADEMGLGKTAEAILTLELLGDDAYPALIICPNSMKFPWREEFDRNGVLSGGFAFWAPDRKVVVVGGSAAVRRKQLEEVREGRADVAIINWEGLLNHTRLDSYPSVELSEKEKQPKELNEIPFRSVVADEAHKAANPRSKQTRALWYMGKNAEYRYALTGTPVANVPEDIWAVMRFIAPNEYPAKTKFVERYAFTTYNAYGFMQAIGLKSETREELFRILDPRLIRRTKAAVLTQLPEKTYTTRTVELGTKQRKAYDSLRKEMLAQLDSGTLLATDSLTQATRLIQFASAHGDLREDGQLVLTAPSCKVDALLEIVAELGEQQAVVFAESRQLIELAAKQLTAEGVRTAQVTGAVPPIDRAQAVQAFQRGDIRVLLVTLGAGGEGLTLTSASVAIFLQRSWSSVKNLQAEDRIHRMGQTSDTVTIVDVIAADTIEAKVHAVRAEKAERLEEVVRDAETLRTWLSR